MRRAMIEQHLIETEQHIAHGEQLIAEQREIIRDLQRDGHDTTKAREVLATLEETQRLNVAAREQIQQELWFDQ
jgi:hypothetical protein